MSLNKDIKIVMVRTSHPGNIGAAARAVKNMGLSQLVLVDPASFPNEEATIRASGSEDILENAAVVSTLEEAVADCEWVFSVSSRNRRLPWTLVTPKECIDLIKDEPSTAKIAFVFGNERTGLTNEELMLGQHQLWIPANPEHPSLNLAQAVQVVTYELYQNLGKYKQPEYHEEHVPWAPQSDLNKFYVHLEKVLTDLEFIDRSNPRMIMQRIKRIFNRSRIDQNEVNILRGILTAMERKMK